MDKEFKNYSVFIARILLGLIFFAAGSIKIADPYTFSVIINNYKILPDFLVNETAFFLPYLEITISFMLFSGILLKGATLISLFLLILFNLSLIFNMARGLNVSCGCFTSSIEEIKQLHYIYYILRDITFFLIAFYIFKNIFSVED